MLARGRDAVVCNRVHTLADADKRQAVEARGGRAERSADGKLRVGGNILVTRALGERRLQPIGLTTTPEVMTLDLQSGDDLLILATDGLWDMVAATAAVRYACATARSVDLIAKRFVVQALDKGSAGNVAVAVLMLHWGHAAPRA